MTATPPRPAPPKPPPPRAAAPNGATAAASPSGRREFGVKRGRDLKPEDRAAFIKKAEEIANG